MGQFSWLDCKTREQILDDVKRDVYVLIPNEFRNDFDDEYHIKEECYDGYGHFGGYDIHELIADWNREFIPIMLQYVEKGFWKCPISEEEKKDLIAFYNGKPFNCDKRDIGIMLSCYNEDNFKMFYPIKITHNKNATYDYCKPSLSDPNQGWKY